jgi:Rhodanese-like domain
MAARKYLSYGGCYETCSHRDSYARRSDPDLMMYTDQWSGVRKYKPMKILLASLLALAAAAVVRAEQSGEKSPLVTTEWLSKNLENPKVRILEVSVEPGVYEQGHIPGAANVKWHTDLVDNPRRDIVSKEQFEALASKLGVTPETELVCRSRRLDFQALWSRQRETCRWRPQKVGT